MHCLIASRALRAVNAVNMNLKDYPDITINIESGKWQGLPYCVANMCGSRSYMEDTYSVKQNISSYTTNPSK